MENIQELQDTRPSERAQSQGAIIIYNIIRAFLIGLAVLLVSTIILTELARLILPVEWKRRISARLLRWAYKISPEIAVLVEGNYDTAFMKVAK